MARVRAADYDDKRRSLLAVAARLFATSGFDRTSISDIAAAAEVSKTLLYHYYRNKDAVLFDIIQTHIQDLLLQTRDADDRSLPPRQQLQALIQTVLAAYRDADDMHKVQINELGKLPEAERQQIHALERQLVDIFAAAILRLRPELAKPGDSRLKPLTMALFGILNWTYLWFREGQPLSREAYGALVTQLFIDGLGGVGDVAAAGLGTHGIPSTTAP